MAAVIPMMIPDLSKLEPLDGANYRRWSQRMLIFLQALEVDYVLTMDPPSQKEIDDALAIPITTPVPATTKKADAADREKHERDNKTVRGHLLLHMNNKLFDMFFSVESSKLIWDTLKNKYGFDEAGRKKYVVGNLLKFQMVDNKPVMDQVHDYELLVAEVLGEGMKICETFQANMLIEKFSPSWNDFRNHLKHEKRDLTLPELISHMRTEEANLVDNKTDWVLDTGASKHLCANRSLFHHFEDADDGEHVFMENSAIVGVLGKGKVLLKLTSGKSLLLTDVLYVPSLRRNLVSGSLLNRAGLKLVFEADKVVLTRNENFVGKGYLSDGLFVLNVVTSPINEIGSASA